MDGAQQDQRGTNTMSDYYKYIYFPNYDLNHSSTIKSSNKVFLQGHSGSLT